MFRQLVFFSPFFSNKTSPGFEPTLVKFSLNELDLRTTGPLGELPDIIDRSWVLVVRIGEDGPEVTVQNLQSVQVHGG
ncbi:MAG: hypothetical protein MI923_10735 [Phycisphaerales bacterium]|nr:hypothetical protein [Phycisphaerales bacterium]